MKKVLLLYGGNSSEHDVSIMSASSIINNIDTNSFDITSVLISKENEWFLSSKNNLKKKIKWFINSPIVSLHSIQIPIQLKKL